VSAGKHWKKFDLNPQSAIFVGVVVGFLNVLVIRLRSSLLLDASISSLVWDLNDKIIDYYFHPVMIAFYNRLKERGKNGKVIVCAIMRKLVHVIFGVLKSGKKYNPNYKQACA
jgi:hypothetical protein